MLGVLAGRVTAFAVVLAASAIVAATVAATPASAAAPPAHPAQGTVRLYVPDAFLVRGKLVTESLSSPSAGQVTVQVGHKRTDALGGLLAGRSFAALDENASFGSRGPFV